jgi:leucyl aminopeptidase
MLDPDPQPCCKYRLGNAQNFARELTEAPANFLTPTQFVEEAARGLAGLNIRDEETFLSEKSLETCQSCIHALCRVL